MEAIKVVRLSYLLPLKVLSQECIADTMAGNGASKIAEVSGYEDATLALA